MKNQITYLKILDWCIVKYGMSRYFDDYPDLEIEISTDCSKYLAEFESENCIIFIYRKVIDVLDVKTMILTVIHEYQHYLQDPKLSDICYRTLEYSENPFEIEAERIAQQDWEECYNDVTNYR
jgi:hypothetical protein